MYWRTISLWEDILKNHLTKITPRKVAVDNHLTKRTRGRCIGESCHQKTQGKVQWRTISPKPGEGVVENHQGKVQWRTISPREPREGTVKNYLTKRTKGKCIREPSTKGTRGRCSGEPSEEGAAEKHFTKRTRGR